MPSQPQRVFAVPATAPHRPLPADAAIPALQRFTTQQLVYVWLCCIFVACLLIADIIGVRLFSIPLPFSFSVPWSKTPIDSITHTCGMITFPATFLLTDLINEYFGRRGARRVTWIGFAMGAFVFAIMNLAIAMPRLDAPFNVSEQSFVDVFGASRIMFVASLSAFLVGQYCDIAVFGVMKRLTGGKLLWLRATGSTVISQLLDSFVVTALAFNVGRTLTGAGSSAVPFFGDGETILKIAATGYLLKFAIAICITPLIYLGHGIMKRSFGLVPVPVSAAD